MHGSHVALVALRFPSITFLVVATAQVNAYVKGHDMFEGRPYWGSLTYLKWYVDITVHCTALMMRLEPQRQLSGWPQGRGHSHRPL